MKKKIHHAFALFAAWLLCADRFDDPLWIHRAGWTLVLILSALYFSFAGESGMSVFAVFAALVIWSA